MSYFVCSAFDDWTEIDLNKSITVDDWEIEVMSLQMYGVALLDFVLQPKNRGSSSGPSVWAAPAENAATGPAPAENARLASTRFELVLSAWKVI